ncbi:hypothetical protein BVG16_15375 [Paenibacillus selenitireducens]|uniref:Lipoprotein n=1 Tax=Paenibacillus selenitireducens TaxID=1324314 RepID=A0A1T2XDW9_9BACL|nr:hypothetical protein [Paenibacillus selenitireducens]OPA77803.1 hypothetical protein BVG16_15375 [Paenibacillus selenitireducens]
MRKWMLLLFITVVASISACRFPGNNEKDAGESKEAALIVQHEQQEQGKEEKENNNTNNEAAEQGIIHVFSNLMSLKLPDGLAVQSKETSNAKLVYTDSDKKVKLEMWHDPEQRVTDADIDRGRLKMKGILEQDGEGEKLEWLKDETMLVHGKHIAVNEVIIPSQKGDTYRLVGWAELDGAFLEIKFSAPADEKDTWQKAVVEMIESIQM